MSNRYAETLRTLAANFTDPQKAKACEFGARALEAIDAHVYELGLGGLVETTNQIHTEMHFPEDDDAA